jgi:hypothetical protein
MRNKALVATVLTGLAGVAAYAGLDGSYVLPLDHPALQYATQPANDAITRLEQNLAAQKEKLRYDNTFGYLPAVLEKLKVPVSSQVLVFSKTSFQAPRISPQTPRALYFNDDVVVGYVRGGDVVEVAAADDRQGIIFYTLEQDQTAKASFARQDQCLQCHATGATLGVPGLVVRSVFADRSGMPAFQAGTFITDHRSAMSERWGGWYVTGTHGNQFHMGNTVVDDKDKPEPFDRSKGANVTDLTRRFDTGAYLSPHSDIVALLVLEHQTRMQNLITRVGFETRMALREQKDMNEALHEPADHLSDTTLRRINNAAEELIRYMLFTDEVPLEGEVRGTSGFTEEYAKQGPRDKQGRSLRELDLKRRLLRYPCSPLIYSRSFDNMPERAKQRIYERLWQILNGKDTGKDYARLTPEDRTAVREILRDTKPNLPSYWN